MFPNRSQLEWLCWLVSLEVLDMIANGDDDTVDLVYYPYEIWTGEYVQTSYLPRRSE